MNVIGMAIINSIIITNLVQKIKENFKINCNNKYVAICLITSMVIGTLFTFTFSNLNFIYSMWSGLLSFLGADFLYKVLEDKIFKSHKNINDVKKD